MSSQFRSQIRGDPPAVSVAQDARPSVSYALTQPASLGRFHPILAANKCTRCNARGAGVCDAVPDEDIGRLSGAAVQMTFKRGVRFIEEGDPAEHFFTLSMGTAKLLKLLPDGRQQITSFSGPGDFLGLAVSSGYCYAAESVDDVTLCRFSRTTLRSLMDDFPAMEKRLLEYTSNELSLAQEQMLLLGRKSARERVATFLVARARKTELCPARGTPSTAVFLGLPMIRSDIADYLGLTVETVSRTLTQLKRSNIIEIIPGSGVVICNFGALEQLTDRA
jgi:CRP/FNR family transcriptional regulator, anaerobic regulatory protein